MEYNVIFPYMGTMHNNQTRVIIISITSSFNYFLALYTFKIPYLKHSKLIILT